MAQPITDEHVAAVLRTFVRGSGPMLARLRQDDDALETAEDPTDIPRDVPRDDPGDVLVGEADSARVDGRLLARIKSRLERIRYPGSESWTRLSVDERSEWWVNRVGRLTALAASVTGLAGALGDRLPLQDILGSAGQGLLLCAIASEHGVDDRGTRVRLLASVLFDREIDPSVAAGRGDDAADEAVVAALTHQPPAGEPAKGRRFGVAAAAKWLWRQGRMLVAISGELEKRPHGRFYHRALGMLPVVGMAGDYFGERSALKRAARAGHRWLRSDAVSRL